MTGLNDFRLEAWNGLILIKMLCALSYNQPMRNLVYCKCNIPVVKFLNHVQVIFVKWYMIFDGKSKTQA